MPLRLHPRWVDSASSSLRAAVVRPAPNVKRRYATSNDSYRSFVAAPGCRSMSAFKVQQSAVAKTAAGSYGSTAPVRTLEQQSFTRHLMSNGGKPRRTTATEVSSSRLDVGRRQLSRYSSRPSRKPPLALTGLSLPLNDAVLRWRSSRRTVVGLTPGSRSYRTRLGVHVQTFANRVEDGCQVVHAGVASGRQHAVQALVGLRSQTRRVVQSRLSRWSALTQSSPVLARRGA